MMMTTNFSEIKKQGRNRVSQFGGREEIRVFGQNIYQWNETLLFLQLKKLKKKN